MTEIDVHCEGVSDGWRCRVRLSDEGGTSDYDVSVSEPGSFLPSILPAPGPAEVERLVRETFLFLLEREPRTAILRRFDLTDVSRYFADYPGAIRARLAE